MLWSRVPATVSCCSTVKLRQIYFPFCLTYGNIFMNEYDIIAILCSCRWFCLWSGRRGKGKEMSQMDSSGSKMVTPVSGHKKKHTCVLLCTYFNVHNIYCCLSTGIHYWNERWRDTFARINMGEAEMCNHSGLCWFLSHAAKVLSTGWTCLNLLPALPLQKRLMWKWTLRPILKVTVAAWLPLLPWLPACNFGNVRTTKSVGKVGNVITGGNGVILSNYITSPSQMILLFYFPPRVK